MREILLQKLVTTGIIAVVMTGTSVESAQNPRIPLQGRQIQPKVNPTELVVPQSSISRDEFNQDLPKAQVGIREDNEQIKEKAVHTGAAPVNRPNASALDDKAAQYKQIAKECLDKHDAEIKKYADKIKTLEAELVKAKETAHSAVFEPSNDEVKEIYKKFEDLLASSNLPKYRPTVQNLLNDLLAVDNSEKSITGFMSIIDKHRIEEKNQDRSEKLQSIYIGLNEEGQLKEYFSGLMRKELAEKKRTILKEVNETKLPKVPDINFIKQYPLLMIYYIDKDKAVGTWDKNNLPTFGTYIKYTPVNYLKAIYIHLTNVWKVGHRLDAANVSPKEAFLLSIYEAISENKKPMPIPPAEKVNSDRFIESKMKNELPIDYVALENLILAQYKPDYDNVIANFNKFIEDAPILKILEIKTLSEWKKLGYSRFDYDKAGDLLKHLNLDELKAILYALSLIKLPTESSEPDDKFFFKMVNNAIEELVKLHETKGFEITGSTRNEMKMWVRRIDDLKNAKPMVKQEERIHIPKGEEMKRAVSGAPGSPQTSAMKQKIDEMYPKGLWKGKVIDKLVAEQKDPATVTEADVRKALNELGLTKVKL